MFIYFRIAMQKATNKHVNRTVFCGGLLRISLRYILSQKASTKKCRLHERYAANQGD